MSTRISRTTLQRSRLARLATLCISTLLIVCADSFLWSKIEPQTKTQPSPSGLQLVVLLDTNPHQKKVLKVELTLAEKIIQQLNQPQNRFSVITFGSQSPILVKSVVPPAEAIAAVRDVRLEQTREKYFSVQLCDAVNLAFDQFTDDAGPKSLLVISEGNDYFPGKIFKHTVSRASRLRVTFEVAMVADHSFYGTKGLQRYGFDLRRLVGKTHGRYVEIGGKEKKIPRAVEQLSENILSR